MTAAASGWPTGSAIAATTTPSGWTTPRSWRSWSGTRTDGRRGRPSFPSQRPARGSEAITVTFLPYGRQYIDQDDIDAVARALQADYLTTGPTVGEFERAFCAATGSPFAAACSNGTAALHLATLALDLGPGDVCVVPAVTFLATAN